ncbi:hypothetical protein DPEC_G00315530 [Dallia pectoralis]|uniref:Uncharacterized protein n=1 Tax=Dallia pectoralis TaxID=75939 RepID=A0ACC2FCH5_DALPE|nr:hypothetical protein DPEC_G00315530 [Dallia pectoralis]
MSYYSPGGLGEEFGIQFLHNDMDKMSIDEVLDKDHQSTSSTLHFPQWLSMTMGVCGATYKTPADVMLKKENRDVELDKKIQALRRKNEALMKRYQEVEEDKKKAEAEGMALQRSKGKAGDLTITFNKSTRKSRVVMAKPSVGASPTLNGVQVPAEKSAEGNRLSSGRGVRKQLLVTMTGNARGKRVVSERLDRRPGPQDVKSPKEEDQYRVDSGRGKRPKPAERDTGLQDEVKQWEGVTEDCLWLSECEPYNLENEGRGPERISDLTIPTSDQEQQEYLRWKMERQEIDRERVARHKNAKGQWRRAWDVDKTENMFPDGDRERKPDVRGGKPAGRGHPKLNADSRDLHLRAKDKGGKDVPVVSSKAKGKDRLTGRAMRWDADNDGEDLQASKTSFEEFLDDLDALGDPDINDSTTETQEAEDRDLKMDSLSKTKTLDIVKSEGLESGRVNTGLIRTKWFPVPAGVPGEGTSKQGKADGLSPGATEKKVRFMELITGHGVYEKPSSEAPNNARSETRGGSLLKVSSTSKSSNEVMEQKQYLADQQDDASIAAPLPLENAKSNSNRNAEDLIDANLSLLSLASGDAQPIHSTGTDKARENGKIV